MKTVVRVSITLLAMGLFFSCKTGEANEELAETVAEEVAPLDLSTYENFGGEVILDTLLSKEDMLAVYANMAAGDSIEIAFESSVDEVCQKKGCWMKLDLGDEENSFVQFKDYEFFVPKDAQGADAIVKGMAYKEEISVDELRHYAEDAGKTAEEIAEITEPKTEYTFLAEGVLLKKNED